MTTNQTIDGVPREFVREGRYIVVKPDYEDDIRTERLRNYIEEMCFHTPDCVVVEADWPEYEPVWRMIEARVTGAPVEGGKTEYDEMAKVVTNDKTVTMSRELAERLAHVLYMYDAENTDAATELEALLAAPVVERQDGSALIRIAADLANRRPLSRLQRICEGTGKISIEHLSEDVDKCGDLLAGIALDIRRAIASPPAPVAVPHTMKSVMSAICAINGFPMLTSNQCHALARSLNKVKELNQ